MTLKKKMFHVTVKLVTDKIVSAFVFGKNRNDVNNKITNASSVKEILSTSYGTVKKNRKKK